MADGADDDGGGGVVDGGPGLVYMPFVVMEDLLDKLKLLNYEEVSHVRMAQDNNNPYLLYEYSRCKYKY